MNSFRIEIVQFFALSGVLALRQCVFFAPPVQIGAIAAAAAGFAAVNVEVGQVRRGAIGGGVPSSCAHSACGTFGKRV